MPLPSDVETSEEISMPEPARLTTYGVAEIFAPLAAIPWRIPHLKLAPGAPAAICGYGYSGKTLFAQELALCIASGKPVFGIHSVRRGRSLHLDYEQGHRVTFERYQRLARAKKVHPAELGDALRLAVFPDAYMPGSADVLERTIEGFDFVVIDSLRASAPAIDENSSDVRQAIDPLARISEKTGATILFIHHGRKEDPAKKGPAKQSMRGSSAIFDAFATVYMLEGAKGEPVRVRHEKCRHTGVEVEDFWFQVQDVEEKPDPRWGLTLHHMGKEQKAAFDAAREISNPLPKTNGVAGSTGKPPTAGPPG